MQVCFKDLSDRDIAESLYKDYGPQLLSFAGTSWGLDEDEALEVLYTSVYAFIETYSKKTFQVSQQVAALFWKIFRSKLLDYLRKKKRMNLEFQDVQVDDLLLTPWEVAEKRQSRNPLLTKLENLLDELEDWERQLLLCRANGLPYKTIAQLTGKDEKNLKVYYQRLIKRIHKKLGAQIDEDSNVVPPKDSTSQPTPPTSPTIARAIPEPLPVE